MSLRTFRHVLGLLLVAAGTIVGCSDGGSGGCGGIIEPLRVITPSPSTLTLDVGATSQVSASLSGGCSSDNRTVVWTSENLLVATVASNGTVTAVGGGTTNLVVTSFEGKARATVAVTVRPKVQTTIDATPAVDTLSPLGTRNLSAVVKDQNGSTMTGIPVVWRSLTPTLVAVTENGSVTALANGEAAIEASAPKAVAGADSLRDTVRVLVVNACSLVRPVVLGRAISGTFDASTCQNLFGFQKLNQYSVTAAAQTFYSIRYLPTVPSSFVPLNISSGFYGMSTPDTAITANVVIRSGTFGFIAAAPANTVGSYTVTTALDPDTRLNCAVTDVTTGVTFRLALTQACSARDVEILPALSPLQQVRITATAAGFPATIELRNLVTRALIARATAASSGGTATIAITNANAFQFGVLRVSGGSTNVNDLVTIAIAQ